MKSFLNKPLAILLFCSFLGHPTFGQDTPGGGGGGGESAAESSVTTSSSKKSAAAPEAIESNPVVTIVKSGLPVSSAINIPVTHIIKIAQAGGTISNLTSSASVISSGQASVSTIISAVDAGISFSSAGGAGFLDVAKKVTAGTITIAELDDVKANLDSGVDLDAQIDFGIADTKTAVQAGYTPAEILEVSQITDAAQKAARKSTIDTVSAQVVADDSVDKDALESIVESSGGGEVTEDQLAAAQFASTLKSGITNTSLITSIDAVIADGDYSESGLQVALTNAVNVANLILADRTISGSTSITTDDALNVASLTQNGYNTELVKLLIKYGAVGESGSTLAAGVLNGFSTTDTTSTNLDSYGLAGKSTSDFLGLLSTLTGDSSIGDSDGDDDNFLNPQTNTVLRVSMDKVSLVPGSNIAIGAEGTSSTVDVSSILAKATNHDDRKVLVVGAAKDLTIAGDTTFTNTNDVEDHALVIGAADELYFRSEYSSANGEDYADPNPITLEYTGSNLGLGSESEMRLVNVNIKTGGNLAIASLDKVYIGHTERDNLSTFTVGTGGTDSDPDNVYIYANELIQVNGLAFAGRVDDVYMDAITIDLGNVTFPTNSDVMLRSLDGGLNFGVGARTVGDVNFIENVRHLSISENPLTASDFDYSKGDGHINSSSALPNGTPHIKIRSR